MTADDQSDLFSFCYYLLRGDTVAPSAILFRLCHAFLVKIVATRCQILRLKCTKFDFGWGSAAEPTGGAYSAPQTL